jgi:haloalkane dehalogenase
VVLTNLVEFQKIGEIPMSSEFRNLKKYKTINGKKMAYIEEGEGDPIVFLHGNPTSSYLWRKVMPPLRGKGRLIAPDLIGMGDSQKLDNSGPDSYSFVEHKAYLFALLDELGVKENVTLIIHDWGSALGFHWAEQNPEKVKAIAFMEAVVAVARNYDDLPKEFGQFVQGVKSEAGEQMILEQNMFIEGILPMSIMRKLDDEEMAEYRRPFLNAGEDRRPTLTWPRQIPVGGEPEDVTKVIADYGQYLATSPTPKLFVNADPGAMLRGAARDLVRGWPNVSEVTVKGTHFIQEDSGEEIGQAIANWLAG